MNIIRQEGLSMPVSQDLINIIFNEISRVPPASPNVRAVTLLFKDVNYSAENGGYHPVEIRLTSRNDEWYFDYITDFKYMGLYPELEKDIDFSWSQRYVFLSFVGDLHPGEGREIFELWQRNFVQYHFLKVYSLTVMWES